MDQLLEISTITIKRGLAPDDTEIPELAKSIKRNGQRVPILINQSFELIDGLRRIEAVRSNGGTIVTARIAETFEMAIDELNESRVDGEFWQTPSPLRVWQINQLLIPYVKRRIKENRQRLKGRPQHSKLANPPTPARTMLHQAFGFNSDSYVGESIHLWNLATSTEDWRAEYAKELAEAVERGEVPLFGVRARLERAEIFRGDITAPADQKRVMNNFITHMGGLTKSVESMGPLNQKITKNQKEIWLKELQELRRKFYAFVKMYEQETQK